METLLPDWVGGVIVLMRGEVTVRLTRVDGPMGGRIGSEPAVPTAMRSTADGALLAFDAPTGAGFLAVHVLPTSGTVLAGVFGTRGGDDGMDAAAQGTPRADAFGLDPTLPTAPEAVARLFSTPVADGDTP